MSEIARKRTLLQVKFRPRNLWVGAYLSPPRLGLTPRRARQYRERALYICIVPMLTIIITRRHIR